MTDEELEKRFDTIRRGQGCLASLIVALAFLVFYLCD